MSLSLLTVAAAQPGGHLTQETFRCPLGLKLPVLRWSQPSVLTNQHPPWEQTPRGLQVSFSVGRPMCVPWVQGRSTQAGTSSSASLWGRSLILQV